LNLLEYDFSALNEGGTDAITVTANDHFINRNDF